MNPVAALVAASLALIAPARAQLLDLGVPDGLGPNEGVAALAIAERLSSRAEALSRTDASSFDQAEAALARLGAALIRSGEADGAAGSVRVVTGLSLAARLDTLARSLRSAPDPEGRLASAWLVGSLQRAGDDIPWRERELDRWLRATLAGGTRLAHGSGDHPMSHWVPAPTAAGHLDAVLNGPGELDEDLRAALERVARILEGVRTSPAFAPSAARVDERLAQAVRSVVIDPPVWVPERSRRALASDLRRTVDALVDPERSAEADAMLERLALAGELLAHLDPRTRDRRFRPLIDGVIRRIDASSVDPRASLDTLAAVELGLRELAAGDLTRYEPVVAAPLAVGWRGAMLGLRSSEDRLSREMIRTLSIQTAPMADPSFLTGLRAHRAESRRFEAMLGLSAYLTGEDPRATYEARGARPRVLAERESLAEALRSLRPRMEDEDPDVARDALATFHGFAIDLERWTLLPGEDRLEAPENRDAARRATGGRHASFARAIRAARQNWLDAWAQSAGLASSRERGRLVRLERTMALVNDGIVLARVLGAADDRGVDHLPLASNAWPGWELPDGVARDAAEAFLQELPGVAALGFDASPSTADAQITTLERRHGLAIVMARIEGGLRDRGLTGRALEDAAAWREFGAGGPDPRRAWLAPRRDELAELCRYATELAHARRERDAARIETLERVVADRQAFVLELLSEQ